MSKQAETLMVGGESAGGGLAVAVCMMARDRGIKVAYQMPLYPMISNIDTESSKDNHGKAWNTRRNHIGWRLYLRKDAKKHVSPYASPAWQTDYSNLPPCYTFVGDGYRWSAGSNSIVFDECQSNSANYIQGTNDRTSSTENSCLNVYGRACSEKPRCVAVKMIERSEIEDNRQNSKDARHYIKELFHANPSLKRF